MGDRVADRVVLEVADVRLTARVGEHLQHVGALTSSALGGLVRDLPGAFVAQIACQWGSIVAGS